MKQYKTSWLLAALLSGCTIDAPLAVDPNGDGGAQQRCSMVNQGTTNAETVCYPVTPAHCGGHVCASGQDCCQATGQCFDPATEAASCARPAGDATGGGAAACAADSQCAADEYCATDAPGPRCAGAGHCASRTNTGWSNFPVCGCNGVTYPNLQTAAAAGVRTSADGLACGTSSGSLPDAGGPSITPCGDDSQCAGGQACCAIDGLCHDPSCTWCCTAPPAGTRAPCVANSDCYPTEWCAGTGCGTVGGCVSLGTHQDCGGELAQVCGCDGRTYTNECWARVAGTRVASQGACP